MPQSVIVPCLRNAQNPRKGKEANSMTENKNLRPRTSDRPICPDDPKHGVMNKAGKVWSGRTQHQMFLCNKCGKKKMGEAITDK